jgi:hypothetical protein
VRSNLDWFWKKTGARRTELVRYGVAADIEPLAPSHVRAGSSLAD